MIGVKLWFIVYVQLLSGLALDEDSLSSFLDYFCSKNPSAIPGLCRNYTSVKECPVTSWGEWQLESFSPVPPSNVSCPSAGRLLRFMRTKNVSHLSPTCKSKAGETSETEDRCPPTTQAKVSALMKALGNDFGSDPVTPPHHPLDRYMLPGACVRPPHRIKPRHRRCGGWLVTSTPLSQRRSCKYGDPRDLAIVIDSSGSVGSLAFTRAVDTLADFISHMCHKFECDGPETRLAVVTYGSIAKTVFNFSYSGATHKSKTNIVNDIKTKTSYMHGFTGSTATGPALVHCRDKIFQERKGMRSKSKRQILLLTDGHSNKGTNPGDVATELHNKLRIDIYALGIGDSVNITELKSITKERSTMNLLYNLLFNDFSEFFKVNEVVKADLDIDAQCKPASKIYDKKK